MEHPGLSAQDVAEALRGLAQPGESPAPAPRAAAKSSEAAPAAAKAKGKPGRPSKAAAAAKAGAASLRTKEGRDAYDASVVAAFSGLGGKNIPARKIRAKVGGTPTQLRASLDRLIEARKVSFSGEKAATRYSAR